MLSRMKWFPAGLTAALVLALFLGGSAWGGKPVKPSPEPEPDPDPPPITYMINWIPSLGGQIQAVGINNDGDVVGAAVLSDGSVHAFLYTIEGGTVDLNMLVDPADGWDLRDATDINDGGQIVGSGYIKGERHAYRFTPQVVGWALVEDLGKLSDDVKSVAYGLNLNGEVCGVSRDATNNGYAFYHSAALATQASMVDILNGLPSIGEAINASGQVIGSYDDGTNFLAFRYNVTSRQIETFGALADSRTPTNFAYDINDKGQFVGKASTRKSMRAYRFTDGIGMLDLGAGDDSVAFGINNIGDVTGMLGSGRGFVYTNEFGLLNLDEAVEGDPEDLALWFSATIRPEAINDSGYICGKGFLLIPVQ